MLRSQRLRQRHAAYMIGRRGMWQCGHVAHVARFADLSCLQVKC